jgi:hypothetical protein
MPASVLQPSAIVAPTLLLLLDLLFVLNEYLLAT